MKTVSLHSQNGKRIAINIDNVAYVSEDIDGNGKPIATRIVFVGMGIYEKVQESYDYVIEQLNK